jgi:hypothetical protein
MTIRLMIFHSDLPLAVARGRFLAFNMLRRPDEHVPMSEFCAALESFPPEWKRKCRNALRESAGLPIPPEDSMPIN